MVPVKMICLALYLGESLRLHSALLGELHQ